MIMRKTIIAILILSGFLHGYSQNNSKDSLNKAKQDSIKMALFESKLVYPLLKAGVFSGVFPVEHVTETPNPDLTYKLLFELTLQNKESAAKEINHGITEICRILNLHVASGIAVKKISPVIVVHGKALYSLYTNKKYRNKFGIDNPNIGVIEDLILKTGARLIACGQAMRFLEISEQDLIPQVHISLTAQTALSSYRLNGFVQYEINEDKE
jgi:intracellular sulfur oxidation DsrE/DsrF family protein